MGKNFIDVDDEHPEHPLFPIEEGEAAPDISYIHVTRWEKGKQVYATKLFTASELLTLDQIQELYGGGDYILIGRAASKSNPGQPGNRMTKHRKITLSGASKPMSDDPSEDELNGGRKPQPVPQAGMLGGGGDAIFIAMMQMNQQAQERAAAAQQQFMTMFIQMMQSSKTESATMTQMMMQMSQSQQQSTMNMVTALMANRGGGPEEMEKYTKLLQSLGFSKSDGTKEDDKGGGFSMEDLPTMIENVADIATAAAELRRGPTPPNGASQPPQITPGDNSAAGIAAAMGLGKG